MNEFDIKAVGWDLNPMHHERSKAVVSKLLETVPLKRNMIALEYGAGTGLTSFLIKDHVKEITMMDNSSEMVKIMKQKTHMSGAANIKSVFFDLEKETWTGIKFDLIITQMVLHHVADTESITGKFHSMLNPGGCLAIADLYPEDGSFHGDDFTGHKGFNTKLLSVLLSKHGFTDISDRKCFEFNKALADGKTKQFDVFLLTAYRK